MLIWGGQQSEIIILILQKALFKAYEIAFNRASDEPHLIIILVVRECL